jgi:MFS family permease
MWRFFHGRDFEPHSTARETETASRPPWKDGIYIFFLVLTLGCGLMFTQLFNTWPLYLRDMYGLLEDKIGLLLAINAFMIVLIEMPLIHRIEAIHPLRVIAVGALFLYGGFTILPWGSGMAYGAFTVIIWTIGEMLIFPMTISFVANRAPDQNRGKYLGMYTMSYSLGFVFGPASGAWIYETWGATQLWICAGCLGILVILGFLVMEQILKREAGQPQAVLKE